MSNKIVILLIGVLVILMAGLGGGLFLMWNKMAGMGTQNVSAANYQPNQMGGVQQPLGPIFSLDTFIVNLADAGGNRYLRVTMDLELNNEVLSDELDQRLPQVRDSILTILPTKRFEDINSAEGKTALRNEILETLNGFLIHGRINKIYFKEFVVQ